MKHAVFVIAVLLFASSSKAQEEALPLTVCSQNAVNRAAAQVDLVRKGLLQLPIDDGLQTDVSPAAQRAIAAMKTALGDFIRAYALCIPAQPDAGEINKELSALGHAFEMPSGVTPIEKIPHDFGKFGFELWFETKVFENPLLLGITAHFSIECGHDTVLFFLPQAVGYGKKCCDGRKSLIPAWMAGRWHSAMVCHRQTVMDTGSW